MTSCYIRISNTAARLFNDIISLTKTHIVPPLPNPVRLKAYGVGIFERAWTKSAWKKALKKQYVRVNDTVASTATFIKGGEIISLSIPEEVRPKKKADFSPGRIVGR